MSIACAALGLLPVAGFVLLRMAPFGLPARRAQIVACLAAGIVMLPTVGWIVRDRITDLTGMTEHARSFKVEHHGRYWRLGSARLAADLRGVFAELDQRASAGDSLFVGPHDLRRANQADSFIYYLVPQLSPASYFLELNPLTANRKGSGLARDLRNADFLVLDRRWDEFKEPNQSSKLGPEAPNEVVKTRFALRARRGPYELYERSG